jgi:putative toxin-antitoxin system antitoxin component (TIGR02293 family)
MSASTVRQRPGSGPGAEALAYRPGQSLVEYAKTLSAASPLALVDVERSGVRGVLVKDLSRALDIPAQRFFRILGIPKATAEKKAAQDAPIAGAGGQAALAMVRLLGRAEEIVGRSTAAEAAGFDTARWLGRWIEQPQPALGGLRPAELLDTPTGAEIVMRLLGALESGSYQ